MKKQTIVVIEDHPVSRKLIRELLKNNAYQIIEAGDAETGIDFIRELKPDLVLMDIKLPAMNGLEATKILKNTQSLKEIPIIAVSAYAEKRIEEEAIELGCVEYFRKPVDTKFLLKRITELLPETSDDVSQKEKMAQSAENQNRIEFRANREPRSGTLRHKKKILIIDDDPRNIKIISGKLAEDKYDIISAENGETGLEKVYLESPDLILLDIMMPGIDGYEVTGRLKNNTKTRDIPIILVTSLDGTDDKIRGLNTGADEFLSRPIDSGELRARVRSLLKLRTYHEQLTSRSESEREFMGGKEDDFHMVLEKGIHTILLVEDSRLDADAIQYCLNDPAFSVVMVNTGEDAISLVQQGNIDIVLLDIGLPGIDGFDVCRHIKSMENTRNIQIVIITGFDDTGSRIKGIEMGADDYLIKPIVKEELKARVSALLKKKDYLDGLNQRFETALQAAITDKLTNLYNHTYFKHYLNREIRRAERQNHMLALLMIDIDNFKDFNDTKGHLAGDEVLRKTSEMVIKTIREVDLAARYGGEELAVVLPYSDPAAASIFGERLRKTIADQEFRFEKNSHPEQITVSIGIAFAPLDAKTVNDLIKRADKELYRAKKEGKNRVCMTRSD